MSDKIIELIKWVISSVAIVVVTIIVDSGFKDRDAGIEEMKLYNQYVDIILQSDNIEQRWRLVEYFSIVTPTYRLRERWILYQDVLRKDYEEYMKLKNLENKMVTKGVSSDSIVMIHDKMENIGGSMIIKEDQNLALEYEKIGCQCLIDKDLNGAIKNFSLSEKSFNGFHSSYEIYNYLKKNKTVIIKDGDWKKVYSDIVNNYSWKLPSEYIKLFKTSS